MVRFPLTVILCQVGAKPKYEESLGKPIGKLYFVTNATQLSKRSREMAKTCAVDIYSGSDLGELLDKHTVYYKDIVSRLDKKRLSP